MANYDEVVKKNKDYLTQAQINALAAASKEYNIANAGNRAGALATAREQYDAGYRGLQNMGLAGNPDAAPTSGEVPRLQMQLKTPFDQYNDRLRQVENQRLGQLGEQFKQETIAAREAERRRQAALAAARAEAERQARLRAAAEAAQLRSISAGLKQTAVEKSGRTGSTITSDIKRQRNVNMTDTGTNGETAREQLVQQTQQARAADYAAAAVLGVSVPKTPVEQYQQDKLIKDVKAAEVKTGGYDPGDLTGRTKVQPTQVQKDARAELKKATDALTAYNKGYKSAIDKVYDPETSKQELKAAQNNLENLKWAKHYGEKVSTRELQNAQSAVETAKLKVENPQIHASMVILSDKNLNGTQAWRTAKNTIAPYLADQYERSLGFKAPNMSDEDYNAGTDKLKNVKKALDDYDYYNFAYENAGESETEDIVSDKEHADNDRKIAREKLAQLMGYDDPDKVRDWLEQMGTERDNRSEYEYYKPAFEALIRNDGEKPTKPVNEEETDYIYRLANNLRRLNPKVSKAPKDGPVPADYMTDEQRDAYNYLYETKGIDAANEYAKTIKPLLNLQRAQQDKDYREQLINDPEHGAGNAILQNILSVGTNLVGNVPAMLEKLAITGYNKVTGENKYIDTNSDMSQLANRTSYIREATSEKIMKNNPKWGKVLNFAYQTGMSMADSAAAMGVSGLLGTGAAVDVLFFSSAGNEAYKDARARGATQEQAMGFAILSGAAEAVFEHVSLETFTEQYFRQNAAARRSFLKKMLIQSGVEASEEFTTEIANKLADAWVMKDKSEYDLRVKKLMSEGMSPAEAYKKAFLESLKDVGMAALGGFASGLGFGIGGGAIEKTRLTSAGRSVRVNGKESTLIRNAQLLGGDVAQQASKLSSSKATDAQLGSLLHEVQLAQNEALGIDAESDEKLTEEQIVKISEKGKALDKILEGEKLTDAAAAQTLVDTLGKNTVKKMGYDGASGEAFMKSYNDRLAKDDVKPMAEVKKEESAKAAGNRVWKDANLGYARMPGGKMVKGMPGNMTAVSYDEQLKSNFAARTTAKVGRTTYAISGMEAREGLSDEQKISELKKNMSKTALGKAEFIEQLSDILKSNMVIHDDLGGAGGYLDKDGTFHLSLSSKQSILRVASHEVLHDIRQISEERYNEVKNAIVKQVGQEEFDKKVAQKTREYKKMGVELSEDGAIEETVAEYSERMLSNTEWLEDFVDEYPEAASTMKDVLFKILNAIKKAFKRIENRNYGTSWSNDIEYSQETLQAMYNGLEAVMERAENKTEVSTERKVADEAKVAKEISEEEAANEKYNDLYMDEETLRAQEAKRAAEATGKKKTYVRGFKTEEIERVIDAGMFGDKSNYEGDDYENARGMIAQLIPEIVEGMKGDPAEFGKVQEKVRNVARVMLDNYFETMDGGMADMREAIPPVIGVDRTAKGDLKYQDQTLFQMSAKLSKALGKKVTLIGEKNAKGQRNAEYRTSEKLDELWDRLRDEFTLSEDQDFSVDLTKLLDFIEQHADTRIKGRNLFNVEEAVDDTALNIIEAVQEMYEQKTGQKFMLSTDELRAAEKNMGDVRKKETYLYENLVRQNPMTILDMPSLSSLKTGKDIDLEKVTQMGLKNAAAVGERVGDSEYSIENIYTKNKIRLSKNAIEHGFDVDDISRLRTNARLAAISGDIVKNAIPLNSVTPKNRQASWAYVMGCLLNSNDRQFVATVLVNRFSNAVESIDFREVAHSVSGRITKEADRSSSREPGYYPATPASDINIKDFLDIVNNTYRSLLSQSVLNHYGEKRPENGLFSKDAIYSLDTDYIRLAEKYKSGTATEAETQQLQQAVEQAAKDAGYSDKMYHGSRKGGGFTVFKGWQYFTPNESYAKRYAQRDNQNSMYSVFVKADNYFDTRKADAKRLFEKYRQEYGLGELQENGLPDWTDGYDLAEIIEDNNLDYDGIVLDEGGDMADGKPVSRGLSYVIRDSAQVKSADPVTYDDKGNVIPLSERFNTEKKDIRWSLDTDAAREAFTMIDTEGLEDGLEALKGVKNVGAFALKDVSRFLDAISKGDKDLRNTLNAIFEKPHSEATGRYARGVEQMQQRVMDIAKRAGVVDEKGKHFDSKKSAAIQNIGEGYSNTYTDLKLKVKDADRVTVRAYDKDSDKLVVSEKDYTLKQLRQAYGKEAADYVWERVFDETQKAQATGKEIDWVDETVNTRPYTLADLQTAFPNEWQQLQRAADEFRQMYEDLFIAQNNMLRTIYPYASEYESVEKMENAIAKKQERLTRHKVAVEQQLQNLQKSLEAKEKEMAGKKRTDTKTFRNLVEQANKITEQIAAVKAEIAEYEANVNEELAVMNATKAQMQNAVQSGESLTRMHRLQYRSDYFHHFAEMASGVQNLKSIFTNNTDISPAIVGRSENTKAKTKWAGYYQQRMGADYTADAINGMLRYGQLAEYKLAFDPLVAYLRDVTEKIRNLDDETNRDGLIKYLMAWTDNIAGKSHKLDRLVSDAGMAPRKAMQVLNWINSRVIQNTLLFNMRSALIQISNVTNAKGVVTNNLDWANGLRSWAAAAKGNEAMQAIMAQSNFLASRYMDNLELTDSKLKSAKAFAGWMLGALDEVSAKATWWAAYTQYQRNPNAKVIQNQYRTYDNAIDYADDVTRRTHAGRGVGELAPAMTSRVVNFVAPFQVEVNNTWQLLKDNVKQKNYLGLLSTGLSVFLLNTVFEALVGSTPLGFDFMRAIIDIVMGVAGDDPDDDKDDYGIKQISQRLAGELVGGLPFATQLVSLIGSDNVKKLLGEDNDATRYGNTQIGVNAVVNAVKGLKDIGTGVVEGRKVNWISDLDDLINLTLPMGGKQLTRTAEGLMTVAKGYGGKYDNKGDEKVQFVTDQDLLHYLHAGLFGKWSLTEASEYFGEERLLPKLFGAYEGSKSSIGSMVDAKEYKAALQTGIDGKDYFTLKYDMKGYTTQAGKRAEMMQQNLTPEQKAQLDALMIPGKDAEVKVEGAVVYQKSGDEWKVKADYTNQDMFDLSTNGDKIYTGTVEAMEKTGLAQDQALLAASMWDQVKDTDDSKAAFRDLLRDNENLTVQQKEALDLQYCGNKYAADYSDPDLYELSVTNRTTYEKAKQAKAQGIPVKNYVSLYDKKNAYSGEDKSDYMRKEIMNSSLSVKQKELLDDLLVSDKGRNPDYSSPAWFEISMLGGGQYNEAKEGTKVGLKPETYLQVYKKWKTLDAKDANGKTVNGLKKKRAKEYLDSLPLSAPVYSYIWTAMFGYK